MSRSIFTFTRCVAEVLEPRDHELKNEHVNMLVVFVQNRVQARRLACLRPVTESRASAQNCRTWTPSSLQESCFDLNAAGLREEKPWAQLDHCVAHYTALGSFEQKLLSEHEESPSMKI